MAAERKFSIDIDREDHDRGPERHQRTRPAAPPGGPDGTSPLWPALASNLSRSPQDAGATPPHAPPMQPPPSQPGSAAEPNAPVPRRTRRLDVELAASLATLAPKPSTTRPITLADALAAMPPAAPPASAEPPAQPAQTGQPPGVPASTFSEPALFEAPTLPSVSGLSPAPAGPPGVPVMPDTRRALNGIAHLHVAAAEEAPEPSAAAAAPDGYLTHSYDFRRSEVAELYDRAVVPFWSAPFGRLLLSAFQRCPRQPGWQVVDVACGTGYPTLELARLLGPDGDVAGLDTWGAGIARARARANALRFNNIAFLVADVAACDLPEQTFDIATCNLGLTSFTAPDLALKGIARLLQPNGTLLLTTNLYGTMHSFFETYRSVLNDLGLVDLSWEVEGLMHQQPTVERVEALLDMAGFTPEQRLNDHFFLRFADGSAFLRSPLVGLSFLPGWRAPVSDTSLRRVVFNEIERRLNAQAAVTGHLDLKVPMLCVTARRHTRQKDV